MSLRTANREHAVPRTGRGAAINPEGRFEKVEREAVDDGWNTAPDEDLPALKTHVTVERAKSIISRNASPRRPVHAVDQPVSRLRARLHLLLTRGRAMRIVNLSPGVDFETRLFAKVNAAELLRAELAKPGYRCELIALGANTDPQCQPIEREYRITRGILEVLAECEHPVGIVTKNAMVERDIDILAPMAEKNLVNVYVSVNNLDHDLARRLEPRCSAPARRFETIRRLAAAGIPVGVLVAPVIPFLTDHQIEPVLEAAHAAGAGSAGYVLMRLPYEVKDLFRDWLEVHYPLKAKHVMSRVHEMRGGRDNDPNFGSRMTGGGELAELLRKRFDIACKRFGFDSGKRHRTPVTTHFKPPAVKRDGDAQLALF